MNVLEQLLWKAALLSLPKILKKNPLFDYSFNYFLLNRADEPVVNYSRDIAPLGSDGFFNEMDSGG